MPGVFQNYGTECLLYFYYILDLYQTPTARKYAYASFFLTPPVFCFIPLSLRASLIQLSKGIMRQKQSILYVQSHNELVWIYNKILRMDCPVI